MVDTCALAPISEGGAGSYFSGVAYVKSHFIKRVIEAIDEIRRAKALQWLGKCSEPYSELDADTCKAHSVTAIRTFVRGGVFPDANCLRNIYAVVFGV